MAKEYRTRPWVEADLLQRRVSCVFRQPGHREKLSSPSWLSLLLSPRPDADILAIATDQDKAEIVSIDPRYCHINLETIVLGYIRDYSAPPTPSPKPNAARIVEPKQPKIVSDSGQSMEGILVSASYLESTRSGYKFKLINSDNEIIAYVDHSKLPEAEPFTNFVNTRLTAWGTIDDLENVDAIVLRAKMLKKKN